MSATSHWRPHVGQPPASTGSQLRVTSPPFFLIRNWLSESESAMTVKPPALVATSVFRIPVSASTLGELEVVHAE